MRDLDRTEKITINLGLVDLGQIDLLVHEGFYTNRTDFIRSAIRSQLATRAKAVDQTVARRTLVLGTQNFTRARPGGHPSGRRARPDPRAGSRDDRRRRARRTRAGDDRLGRGARRVSRQPGCQAALADRIV